MSRDELSASQREELAALDRILAREPVDERHLELAALVDSVRAGAPRIDPAFAERLDQRMAARRRRGGRRLPSLPGAGPGIRRFALAGGGLVAAAVVFTIVISSGVLTAAKHPAARTAPGTALVPRPPVASGAATTGAPSGLGTSVPSATAGSGASGQAKTPSSSFSAVKPAATRLVALGSTLTLASTPSAMQGVANQIVADTEQAGGVVERSNVDIQGSLSHASFSLQVPSGRLGSLITAISRLASLRAVIQTSHDITDGYSQEQARLADSLAEHAALLKQLTTAATLAQQTAIDERLSRLAARIAAEHQTIDRLLTEGRTANLAVSIVPGASAKHATVGALRRAYCDALRGLQEILAIELIALAIVLPFALSALALWWGATAVRQRARERAMRTT